jgi:hypothetical protein
LTINYFRQYFAIPAGSLKEVTKSIKSLQIKRLQAFLFAPTIPKRSNILKVLVSNSVSQSACKVYSPEIT